MMYECRVVHLFVGKSEPLLFSPGSQDTGVVYTVSQEQDTGVVYTVNMKIARGVHLIVSAILSGLPWASSFDS